MVWGVKKIDLVISCEEDEKIDDLQYQSFQGFIDKWKEIESFLLDEILLYYINLRKKLGFSDGSDKNYPEVTSEEEIKKMIELETIVIPLAGMIVIFIFFAATMAIARLGLFFLFPLGFYMAAVPYLLHRYVVKKKFYQIPDAEKYCQTFEITQPEGLELFEQTPAFVYFGIVPDDKTLRFLYNFYRKCGSLRQEQSLRLVHVTYDVMNRRYGTLFQNDDEGFWCVSSEDVDINKYTAICYYSRMTIYDGWLCALLEQKAAAESV